MIYSTQRLRWRSGGGWGGSARGIRAKAQLSARGRAQLREARPWELLRAERTQPQIF